VYAQHDYQADANQRREEHADESADDSFAPLAIHPAAEGVGTVSGLSASLAS
jgi:hypothetical protein